MKSKIVRTWQWGIGKLARIEALGPLVARLSVGAVFFQSGLGKLNHLERTTEFFRDLGIVAPDFHARFVGGLECVGGLCLVVGLGTRLFSIPLAFTMIVAVLTAQLGEVDGIVSLLSLSETTIFSVLVWLVLAGPGALSLDHLVFRRLARRPGGPAPGGAFADAL